MNIEIREVQLDEEIFNRLIAFSTAWEQEHSCRGYCRNSREYIGANRIFLADIEGKTVGYLMGHAAKTEAASSVMPENTGYFLLEEIYVSPEMRSQGVGKGRMP